MTSDSEPAFPDVRILDDAGADSLYLDLNLPAGERRPYVLANTVVTADGKTAFEGRSTPIGSRFDRAVMRRLRAAADAVIIGAGTLRAEEIEFRLPPPLLARRADRGLPPWQSVVVVSSRGDLPMERRVFSLQTEDVRPVVVTSARGREAMEHVVPAWVRILVAGEGSVNLPEAVAALRRDLGVRHAVLEGGPSLNAAMLDAGLVDEILFTLAPRVLGGPALTMIAGAQPLAGGLREMKLLSALAYGGELYLRYRVRASGNR